jgi:CTP-dependent riboflavin kinase
MGQWSIKARAIKGLGLSTTHLSKDASEINEILSLRLRNGTLNLISNEPLWFDKNAAIFNAGNFYYWKAWLNDLSVILVRFDGCPAHIFEIFAEEHLRSKFGLSDGDTVIISGEDRIIDATRTGSSKNRIVWYLTWRYREALYRPGLYQSVVESPRVRIRGVWRANQ